MRKALYILLSMVCASGVSACTSTGIGFADRDDLAAVQDDDGSIDEFKYENFRMAKKVRTLGAITMADDDEDESNDAKILLKRYRSRVYAESTLYQSDNVDKTMFDQSSFNIGLDKKSKGLGMELSLKF